MDVNPPGYPIDYKNNISSDPGHWLEIEFQDMLESSIPANVQDMRTQLRACGSQDTSAKMRQIALAEATQEVNQVLVVDVAFVRLVSRRCVG